MSNHQNDVFYEHQHEMKSEYQTDVDTLQKANDLGDIEVMNMTFDYLMNKYKPDELQIMLDNLFKD